MKYYLFNYQSNINGIISPGLSGNTVKNYQDFFNNKKCTPTTFYDKEYEFDYLTPLPFGEGETEPQIIADFHLWINKRPMKGKFYPISKKFKEILEQHTQFDHRFYKARVLFKGEYFPYFVWRILSKKYQEYIDFDKTRYNNLNTWRKLKHDKLEVKQFSSYDKMDKYSEDNWDYDWNYERLVMKSSFRELDYCYIFGLGSGNVVSERLKIAIEEAGLTGIRFEPVPIPIEFSDEVE